MQKKDRMVPTFPIKDSHSLEISTTNLKGLKVFLVFIEQS